MLRHANRPLLTFPKVWLDRPTFLRCGVTRLRVRRFQQDESWIGAAVRKLIPPLPASSRRWQGVDIIVGLFFPSASPLDNRPAPNETPKNPSTSKPTHP